MRLIALCDLVSQWLAAEEARKAAEAAEAERLRQEEEARLAAEAEAKAAEVCAGIVCVWDSSTQVCYLQEQGEGEGDDYEGGDYDSSNYEDGSSYDD